MVANGVFAGGVPPVLLKRFPKSDADGGVTAVGVLGAVGGLPGFVFCAKSVSNIT